MDTRDITALGDALAEGLHGTTNRLEEVHQAVARYNGGRPIAQNARELFALAEELSAGWPVPLEELTVFGHSARAVVTRGAIARGAGQDVDWAVPVAALFTHDAPGGVDATEPRPRWVQNVRLPVGSGEEISHFRLLNHPTIYAQITERLSARIAPDRARAARARRFGRAAKALQARRPSRRR